MCEAGESVSGTKRKRKCLTLNVKREIIDKRENGARASDLMKMYEIGRSTLYDVLNSKSIIFERAQLQNGKKSGDKKLFRQPSSVVLDENLHEWFVAKRSEGKPVSGPMVVAKAKQLNEDLKLNLSCKFSVGWLRSFKERYGIRKLNITKDRKCDNPGANRASFQSVLSEHGFTADEVYNADEAGINWKCLPTKILARCGEKQAAGLKHNKERLTVLVCGNASGKHKLKLLVIGKCARRRAFKNVIYLPVIYRNQKNAWMSKGIFKDWFFNSFVPSVRENLERCGKSKNTKCLLLLDNRASHPSESVLVSDCGNIYACYFPPNVTSLIQPMDQGVIMNLKCHYKSSFMLQMMHRNVDPVEFQRTFTIKDGVYLLQEAWDAVKVTTVCGAWHRLWPRQVAENEAETNEKTSNSAVMEQGILSLKEVCRLALDDDPLHDLDNCDLQSWIEADANDNQTDVADCQTKENLPNDEDNSCCPSSEEDESAEEITWESVEKAIECVIQFMERKPIFNSEDSVPARRLQQCLATKKLEEMKREEIRKKAKEVMNEITDG